MGSMPQIKIEDTEDLIIPLPPLAIQEKIVEVLDNFDKVCNDLKIGLPAEIEARKQQFYFYRDGLLNFAKEDSINQSINDGLIKLICQVFGCINLKLNDVCKSVCSGGTPSTVNSKYYDGDIPWLRTQEVDFCDIYKT